MNRATRITTICFAVILMFAASTADAGWALTESNGDETVISNGKMRSAWENGSVIFDASTDKIYFIDDRRKILAEGTVDELCDGLNQMMATMMADIPEEQREMMKQMMENATGEVSVVEKGPGEKIAGFETTRYEVLQGGNPYETLWLTNNESLNNECHELMQMLMRFSACTSAAGGMGAATPESAPAYLELFDSGMVVKSTEHGGEGEASHTTVIAPKEVPDSEFTVPDGYEKVPLSTMWGE